MIRAAAIGLAGLAAAVGVVSGALAEGGPIRSGEHDGFSRIVMEIEPRTEWSLERTGDAVAIVFPRKAIAFGTARIFDLIPRTRIREVETSVDAEGTTVSVTLGCDCRVSTVFVGARWLALDVSDRAAEAQARAAAPLPDAAPEEPGESPEARDARELAAVSSAEEILIRQIERAAGQGLIELAGTAPAPPGTDPAHPVVDTAPAPPPRPSASAPPVMPLAIGGATAEPPMTLGELLDQEQVRAVTVFDRDRPAHAERRVEPVLAVECRPDADFALAGWADGRPAHAQIAARSVRLLGEFDRPDPEALRAIARIQIRFGLGSEAELLLGAFDVAMEDRPLLVDLARAVEERPPRPGGPLSVGAACPGAHGLWLAIAGTGPAYRDAAHFAGIAAAFGELPPDLRSLLGPGLIGRLIDEDRADAARLIYETMRRPEPGRSAALRLAEARLVALEGSSEAAARAMGDLVEENAPNAAEALRHLARLALDTQVVMPERLVSDLASAARLFEATPRGPEYRALLAEALAARGEIAAAIAELRAGRARWPGDARFPELAVTLLGEADPTRTGARAYAETVLTSSDLLPGDAGSDPVRRGIARHLIDLGLAGQAREMLAPAVARREAAARLLDAEAALELGEAALAREILGEIEGAEAAELRARAFARDGAFDVAVETLVAAGLEPEADGMAWASGDWARAAAAAEDDAARQAMARYMAARADPAAAVPPAGDPEAPSGAEAFAEPLPGMEPASLAAARRLLATGREVEDFVAELLRAE